ncbi:hypothetical protein ESCO_001255 [Escovopsis weberi]|uniref:Cytochrome b561 domain-containing protein n=1 Tax=Escovopsis weberi TaxID=150374 RepID=A0A0M9VU84_ESCWE|nr:hypothetical protein ESCO_001255 [Escovopsis weberi]
MAPAPDQLSAPGAAHYDSDTLHVGDGTWEFTKNTFLLPNLQGTNLETLRYNGMGNRFSTVQQYHTLITAHGVLMAIVFMFLLPTSVMIVRFYSREPGYAIRYHAQLNVFSAVLLVSAFILPFFAVGQARSLTNPHHGIGVAIFTLFLVQMFIGGFVKYITKIRSLRVMLHQWLGRATALLGIVQIPLGLALYGSPKALFILYAVWMGFLLVLYFLLSYHSEARRELYMSGPRSEIRSELRSEVRSELRSEGGRTRMTESEYFSEHDEGRNSKLKWLGPLAAAAGLFALLKGRKDRQHDDDDVRSRAMSGARSYSQSRRTTVLSSRPPSGYYDEKLSEAPDPTANRGGGLMKVLGVLGLARLFGRNKYSAVNTDTPWRQRSERATTISEFNSEYTNDASTVSPSNHPAGTTMSAAMESSRTPRYPGRAADNGPPRGYPADSEYSSYVSPSRRATQRDASGGGNGAANGILAGLGLGWLGRKLSKRGKNQREAPPSMRDDDDYYRSPTEYSRQTREGDSPRRSRPPARRYSNVGTETALSEITESSFAPRPQDNPPRARPRTPTKKDSMVPPALVISPDSGNSRTEISHHQGTVRSEVTDATARPTRESSRRRNNKDHSVTLRRLTDEEMAAARDRGESVLESPTTGRGYRRDSSQRKAEEAAERAVEARHDDNRKSETPLSPPHPSFAKGGPGPKRNRDSAYFQSGQQSLNPPPPPESMVSSAVSHGTWSGMSIAPSQPKASETAAADNRRRRRQERRRGSGGRPSESAD